MECEHNRRTQNFSDVFGYYETCLDCGNDLDNKIKPKEKKDCKFIYGFTLGVTVCIIAEIINTII
ncbi:hypothetical protein [Patiriisocius marinus]|uniref:hypothetical protein n=1 Tax=Patiriisocius marinus TaxID=1397112 RepID=UPI00232F232C|nr:hypothetical protein [Patiriisocius marinus]